LNIASLTGKVWCLRCDDTVETTTENIAKILAKNRGINDLKAFTSVSIAATMPDPMIFIDMEKAVCRIIKAIQDKQKIAILGDYDVDGVASVSILVKFLKHIGADYVYAIPNRVDDGYGLNKINIEKHRECLVIAVDCGSGSLEELAYAKQNLIDVVILDHHSMSVVSADAIALVNPHRPDESGKYRYLCAAGVVFLCVWATHQLLKEKGFYAGGKEPNLEDYMDLVALATVCDVVDLVELNRAFVIAGTRIIRQRKNIGIDALLSVSKNVAVTAEAISFSLGPKLNSAGRMSSADLSVQLLTTENPLEAKKIALHLDDLNKERQMLERMMMEEAVPFIKEGQNFILAYKENWHLGIIGIIAGRLREKYNRPSIIVSRDPSGVGKASCRSVDGVNISELIRKGMECGVIISGGGHAMAAGFSFDFDRIGELENFLFSAMQKYSPAPPTLYADCVISLNQASIEFLKSVSTLEPFGMGNYRPKFVIQNVRITGPRIVGEDHISLALTNNNSSSLRTISFRSHGTPLGKVIFNEDSLVNVLGTLTISLWNGRESVNFQLEDIAHPWKNEDTVVSQLRSAAC
jgi:single-stranded-DNA-specific exonuclease